MFLFLFRLLMKLHMIASDEIFTLLSNLTPEKSLHGFNLETKVAFILFVLGFLWLSASVHKHKFGIWKFHYYFLVMKVLLPLMLFSLMVGLCHESATF